MYSRNPCAVHLTMSDRSLIALSMKFRTADSSYGSCPPSSAVPAGPSSSGDPACVHQRGTPWTWSDTGAVLGLARSSYRSTHGSCRLLKKNMELIRTRFPNAIVISSEETSKFENNSPKANVVLVVCGADGDVSETISWMARRSFSRWSGLLIPISLWISVSLSALIMAPDFTFALHAATYHAGIPTHSSSQATIVGPFHSAKGVPAFIASPSKSCR